jgi:hypothetical protein
MMTYFKKRMVVGFWKSAFLFITIVSSQTIYAKWDEERDITTNGKDELVYYFKTNDQGQKLVLDKYVKRLIFIRPDKFYKRSIGQIKIDGVVVDVTSDPFSHYPEQTAIVFENKDEVLKRLFLAKKIEFNVFYGREEALSVFQIK